MFKEIRNLPSFIQGQLLEHKSASVVRESELTAEGVARYFRSAGHPLDLTPNEHRLLQCMLEWKVMEQDPRVLTDPKDSEKVKSYFHRKQNQTIVEMGFMGENQILANLIYSPLDDIAQLWVKNYQEISVIGQEIDHGPNDHHFKLDKTVEIADIIQQTMEKSDGMVKEMRGLELKFHPLQVESINGKK